MTDQTNSQKEPKPRGDYRVAEWKPNGLGGLVEVPIFLTGNDYTPSSVCKLGNISESRWLVLRRLLSTQWGYVPKRIPGDIVTHLLKHGKAPELSKIRLKSKGVKV